MPTLTLKKPKIISNIGIFYKKHMVESAMPWFDGHHFRFGKMYGYHDENATHIKKVTVITRKY